MKKGKATKLNDLMDIYDSEFKARFDKYRASLSGSHTSLNFDIKHGKLAKENVFCSSPRGDAYHRVVELERLS